MSFLKRLFGGGTSVDGAAEEASDPVEHKGFWIRATPFSEAGQFQTCGVITKEIGGEVKEHRFVRADRFAAKDDAVEQALRKGRQIIDEQGERIFNQ